MRHPRIHDQTTAGITIRRLGAADTTALTRLAQLDSAEIPTGDMLGAEFEGELVAAIDMADGRIIADPFTRTSELRALLELRAAQLRCRERYERREVFAVRPTPAPAAPS